MGLETYWRKRNFGRTPEPKGKPVKNAPERLRFVIQKHAASHLHYDFRLEMEGVLRSWAVPKGPSVDPGSRRLAMETEDHPLDYGDFEGVIPEGEYGGGTVIVWDQGFWIPVGDPVESYRKGKLEFDLEGAKLRGGWRLVRMAARNSKEAAKPAWLLFKRHDKEAGVGADGNSVVIDERSVLSGRTLEEVRALPERVWHSNRTKEGGMAVKPAAKKRVVEPEATKTTTKAPAKMKAAKTVAAAKGAEPASSPGALGDPAKVPGAKRGKLPATPKAQLATLASEAPNGAEWLHEIKLDGYRLLARLDGGEVSLVTRNGNDWTDRFAPLAQTLAQFPCKTALLDGEAVVMSERGISSFQQLQNVLGRGRAADVLFYAFDLLFLDGIDLRGCALRDRKESLRLLLLRANHDKVRYSDHLVGRGDGFHQEACRMGLEGIVSKLANGTYQEGRSRDWLKVKCLQRQEFVIVGYTDPGGARKGLGALLLGVYDEGQLVFCGKVGTGFTAKTLDELYRLLKPLEVSKPRVVNAPRGAEARGVHWLVPDKVAEVAFTEWTDEGSVRHPSFQGLREDKPATQIVREKPLDQVSTVAAEETQAAPKAKPKSKAKSKAASAVTSEPHSEAGAPAPIAVAPVTRARGKASADPVVAGVRLSNPSKLLFPEVGVTKLDLARYYEQVAPLIVPYLKSRPLTLLRCPEGQSKTCFFQKHANDTIPQEIPRVLVKETDEGQKIYMMIDDLTSIIRLVQLSVLEFHVWGSKADKLEAPDIIVFDIDPAETVPWKDVVITALALRERLQELGLATYPRFTGGKGIHVVVPLVRKALWDDVKNFSLAIAEEFVRKAPKVFSARLAKRGREGKIFIDYLRNTRNATAVASYSARAKPGAPVALPVRWEHIEQSKSPLLLSVKQAPAWLEKLGEDPWLGFEKDRKMLSKRMLSAVGLG